MVTSARVQIINEVVEDEKKIGNAWVLCLQWCRYVYDNGSAELGYRFIWRRETGKLQAARGQARIPSLERATALMEAAKKQGWGNNEDDSEKIDNR